MSESEPTPPRAPGPLSHPYTTVTTAMLVLVTIVAFETMAVSTAMPVVALELHAVRAYGFAFSVMFTAQLLGIVLAGVWTDRSGPLPGTLAGQVLVAGGSALCGATSRFDVFLIGRVLTGLGGGLLVVMLYVIAGRVYPEHLRPRLFTYVSAAWILPALLGAPIAAMLTTHVSWRWVFWLVVGPTVIAMLAMGNAARGLDHEALHARVSNRDHSAHLKAARAGLGIAIGAGLVQYGIHEHATGRLDPFVLAILGIVAIVLTAPRLVPAGTWAMARGLPSVMFARAALTAAFSGALTYVPLFLVDQRHAPTALAGLVLASGSLGWSFGSWWQGRESLALPRHRLVEVGGIVLTAALVTLAVIAALNLKAVLTVPVLVAGGFAMGIAATSTTVLALDLSSIEDHGAHSSSLQLADVLGSTLGIAAATALYTLGHHQGRDNLLYGAIFVFLALVGMLVVPAGQRIRT